MATVTAVTARYLPNLRHLARLGETDFVVILDLAHMPNRNRESFVNRNRVLDLKSHVDRWVTVPILRRQQQPMGEVLVDATAKDWWRRHQRTIESAYAGGRWLGSLLCERMNGAQSRLLDVNCASLEMLTDVLSLPTSQTILESSLLSKHTPSHRMDIMRAVNADTYLAGEVEVKHMAATGELRRLTESGFVVEEVGALGPDSNVDQCIRLSAVHSILTQGIPATAAAVKMIRELPRALVTSQLVI